MAAGSGHGRVIGRLAGGHLTGGVFLHAEFFAPWCMAARVAPEHCAPLLGPASHLILYHYVVEGELHVRVEGEEAFVLGPERWSCSRATTCTCWAATWPCRR